MNPSKSPQQPASNIVQPTHPGEDFAPNNVNPPAPPAAAGPAASAVPPANPVAKNSNSNPNSTQNTLLISEVRDGVVIMNDGMFRAVIMCKSINFDLMSPQEREAVEFSYQGFLNSLYFPVQIFIRSQKVDLRPYLEKLDKIRVSQDNMLLGLLMEDYVAFLADIAQQTNIMDKKFYLIISYPEADQDVRSALKQSTGFFTGAMELFSPNKTPHVVIDESVLEKAKTELRNRVQAVMQGLLQCGIQSLPLDTQELIELYYDVYNPDTATRQQLKNFEDLSAPIVEKASGAAPVGAQL
jgi:type IV secretory pathway VirB4 component